MFVVPGNFSHDSPAPAVKCDTGELYARRRRPSRAFAELISIAGEKLFAATSGVTSISTGSDRTAQFCISLFVHFDRAPGYAAATL
jgi:hypothetical protein